MEGKLHMLLLDRKSGLDSLFKEVRVFKVRPHSFFADVLDILNFFLLFGGRGRGGGVRGDRQRYFLFGDTERGGGFPRLGGGGAKFLFGGAGIPTKRC